jgi:hypothetical protein
MKKEILTFSSYESMWSFKEKSQAINVRIEPKKNRISGLFNATEVELALKEFQAIRSSDIINPEEQSTANNKQTIILRPRFKKVLYRPFLVLRTFLHSFI